MPPGCSKIAPPPPPLSGARRSSPSSSGARRSWAEGSRRSAATASADCRRRRARGASERRRSPPPEAAAVVDLVSVRNHRCPSPIRPGPSDPDRTVQIRSSRARVQSEPSRSRADLSLSPANQEPPRGQPFLGFPELVLNGSFTEKTL